MALCKTWAPHVAADPSIVSLAVESGLCTLGYDSIKLEQLAAVASLLKGEDVFMSVPTGFGKSLVYQILPYCSDSLLRSCGPAVSGVPAVSAVVIVSPLISLMQDQVSKLTSRDIKAVCIAGEHRHDVYSDIMESPSRIWQSRSTCGEQDLAFIVL